MRVFVMFYFFGAMEKIMKIFALMLIGVLLVGGFARTNNEPLAADRIANAGRYLDGQAQSVHFMSTVGKQSGHSQRASLPSNASDTRLDPKTQHKVEGSDCDKSLGLGISFAVLPIFVVFAMYGICIIRPEFAYLFSGRAWLQHTALILIVSALVFLGMSKILVGNEIAPLIGAIAGYLLGRGAENGNSSPASNPSSS